MWSLITRPCSVEVHMEVCVRYDGGGGVVLPSHMYEWACHSLPCDWCTVCVFIHLYLCVRKSKERQSDHKALQSVSMNGLSRGKLSLIVKLFGRSLFLRHLMLNSSTFLCHFFFLLPLRMSSDHVFLPSWFLLSPKWPLQMYNAPKRAKDFLTMKQKKRWSFLD